MGYIGHVAEGGIRRTEPTRCHYSAGLPCGRGEDRPFRCALRALRTSRGAATRAHGAHRVRCGRGDRRSDDDGGGEPDVVLTRSERTLTEEPHINAKNYLNGESSRSDH